MNKSLSSFVSVSKLVIVGAVAVLSLESAAQSRMVTNPLPEVLVGTQKVVLNNSYSNASLATLRSRGIDTDIEISTYQVSVASPCNYMSTGSPRMAEQVIWKVLEIEFVSKTPVVSGGAVTGQTYKTSVTCGKFQQNFIPACTSGRMC